MAWVFCWCTICPWVMMDISGGMAANPCIGIIPGGRLLIGIMGMAVDDVGMRQGSGMFPCKNQDNTEVKELWFATVIAK